MEPQVELSAMVSVSGPQEACDTLDWNAIMQYAQYLTRDGINLLQTSDAICPQPALHLAARSGHEHCMSVLLANGADAWTRDAFGDTALHLAAAAGAEGCVRQLLQAGGDLLGRARNYYGEDALFKAVAAGKELVVAELVAHTRKAGISSDVYCYAPGDEDIIDEAIDMADGPMTVHRVDNPRTLRVCVQGLLGRQGRRRLAAALAEV